MKLSDRRALEGLVACMQFILSIAYVIGFFYVTDIVLTGGDKVEGDRLRLADQLFGSMTTILAVISGYWFSRQRGQPPESEAPPNEPRQPAPPG